MSTDRSRRIDFKTTAAGPYNKTTRMMKVKLEPDPERYEWRTVKGEKLLYDKMDDIYIAVEDLGRQMKDMPIYWQPPKIGNAEKYLVDRQTRLVAILDGNEPIQSFGDKSEEFLQSLGTDSLRFAIMSVDVVGSTRALVGADSERDYAHIMAIVQSEFAAAIANFNGHVLKYTGDGVIAYFAEPSFVAKNDLAADCAVTVLRLVHSVLNPVFCEYGLSPVEVRIGLDSGRAYIQTIGDSATKRQKDILGKVVSLACKIQSSAQPGEIRLGKVTERNLHTGWRQICSPVACPQGWRYIDKDTGKPYELFRLDFRAS